MGYKKQEGEKRHRINREIKSKFVRLVGDNVKPGVYPLSEALKMAQEMGLDLVEVAVTENESVCRIMDYNKYLYEKKKQAKERGHHAGGELKEVRITPFISEHDLEVKARHAREFIEEKNKVRVVLLVKGGGRATPELLEKLSKEKINKFIELLSDIAKPEGEIKFDGKRIVVNIIPKKKA